MSEVRRQKSGGHRLDLYAEQQTMIRELPLMVGKVASVKIKESVLKELLTKKTEVISRICLKDEHEV